MWGASIPLKVQYDQVEMSCHHFVNKCCGLRAKVDLRILKSNLFFKDIGLRIYNTPGCMINVQCFYFFDKGIH